MRLIWPKKASLSSPLLSMGKLTPRSLSRMALTCTYGRKDSAAALQAGTRRYVRLVCTLRVLRLSWKRKGRRGA
eukprot:12527-Chlamydomonas_euryale.AAC.3